MKVRRIKDVQIPPYKINKRKRKIKRILRFVKCLLVTILFANDYRNMLHCHHILILKNLILVNHMHYDENHLMEASRIQKGVTDFGPCFQGLRKFLSISHRNCGAQYRG